MDFFILVNFPIPIFVPSQSSSCIVNHLLYSTVSKILNYSFNTQTWFSGKGIFFKKNGVETQRVCCHSVQEELTRQIPPDRAVIHTLVLAQFEKWKEQRESQVESPPLGGWYDFEKFFLQTKFTPAASNRQTSEKERRRPLESYSWWTDVSRLTYITSACWEREGSDQSSRTSVEVTGICPFLLRLFRLSGIWGSNWCCQTHREGQRAHAHTHTRVHTLALQHVPLGLKAGKVGRRIHYIPYQLWYRETAGEGKAVWGGNGGCRGNSGRQKQSGRTETECTRDKDTERKESKRVNKAGGGSHGCKEEDDCTNSGLCMG